MSRYTNLIAFQMTSEAACGPNFNRADHPVKTNPTAIHPVQKNEEVTTSKESVAMALSRSR